MPTSPYLYTEYRSSHDNRPTLVFLHDSLGCTSLWRDFPQKLADATQCNLLVYDRLGYGKSDPMLTYERPVDYMETEATVLNNLLESLNINDVVLFGHSDGGTIALLAASKYPKKIKAVIVEAAHIFVEEVTLKGIHEAIEAYENTDLPQRLTKYHGDKVEMLFKAWTATWIRKDFRDWTIVHFLPQIICPLLFIQGEDDDYGSLEQVEKTISQVSGKPEKYIIPNTGHTPHKEAPVMTLKKATDFIQQLDS